VHRHRDRLAHPQEPRPEHEPGGVRIAARNPEAKRVAGELRPREQRPGAERGERTKCGFSLAEIRELLELRSTDSACCDDIYRVAVEKKPQLAKKIKALAAMSAALSGLIEICSHDKKSLDECPILGALEEGLQEQDAVAFFSASIPSRWRRFPYPSPM